jgi:hypothetical protein
MQRDNENLITRLNYSPRLKSAVAGATFLVPAVAFHFFERGPHASQMPAFTRGRLSDVAACGAAVGMAKTFMGTYGDNYAAERAASVALAIDEFVQLLPQSKGTVYEGTFDWGDIGAIFVGLLCYRLYEKSAELLHDSGATLMAYHALGIQHRKFG